LSQAWFDWRSEKVAQVHDQVAAALRRVRPDLEYSVTVEYPVEAMYARGRSALEVMRDVGYDPRAYRQRKQYSSGRDIWSYTPIAAGRAIGLRQWLRDEEVVRLLGEGSGLDRWTLVRTGFHEWAIGALAGPTGTRPWDSPLHGTGYFVSHAAPAHRSWAERFLRSVIDDDVDTMQYGFCDSVCPAGEEHQMQRLAESSRRGACRQLDAAVAALAAGQVNAAWEHLTPVLELKSE